MNNSYPEFGAVSPSQTLAGGAKKYTQELAREQNASEDMIACFMITMFAAVQNGSKCLVSKNYLVLLTLYLAIAAPSGAGKTPIKDRMLPALVDIINKYILLGPEKERMRKAEKKVIKSAIKKLLKEVEKVNDADSRLEIAQQISSLMKQDELLKLPCSPLMGDTSIQAFVKEVALRNGIAMHIDAEGGILNELDTVTVNKLSPILKAWSGETIEDITKNDQILVESPSVVISVMTQIDPLLQIVTNPKYREKGLVARFLIHTELNWQSTSKSGCVSDESEQWYSNRLEEVFVMTGKLRTESYEPCLFSLTDGAYQVLICFKQYASMMQERGYALHNFKDLAEKIDQQAVRIAMCLHGMDYLRANNFAINENTMQRACNLALYFANCFINFTFYGAHNDIIKNAKPIINDIVNHQSQFGISSCFLSYDIQRFNGYSKSKIDKILLWMVKNKWIIRQFGCITLPSGEQKQVESWMPIIDFRTIN